MIQAARQRAVLTHARQRALRRWLLMLSSALLVVVASAGAMQQTQAAPALQDAGTSNTTTQDPASKPVVKTRGISTQAANEAAASQLEQASPDEQAAQVSTQATETQATEMQATEMQANETQANETQGNETQATEQDAAKKYEAEATHPAQPAAPADAVARPPLAVGANHGVLFRVMPPSATTLPAELAVDSDAAGDAGSQADTQVAASSPAPLASASAAARPSYLLGTIHFGTPEEQGIDYAKLEHAMSGVDTFVNEADLDEAWKPAYDDYRWLSPEQPLTAMVSKDSYAMARSLLPNIRPQDLVRMKPWSVLALLEARGETGNDATMDARLQRIATASGKRLVHLETLEQQLQALDCVPAAEHSLVLDERLRAPWILRDESAAAMRYYQTRNLDAWLADIDHMYGLSYAGKAIEQRSRQCLLEDRNARWLGQLETLFQDGPSFVAVGAVHLVGSDGLLAALRRDGYRIEVVPL